MGGGPDFLYPEWELLDDVIHKIYGVCLSVAIIDLEGPHPGRIHWLAGHYMPEKHRWQYTETGVYFHRLFL